MKYFLDTEFIEDGVTIDLISIGVVSEDDRKLYLQNSECNFKKASDWVWRNVFPHLIHFRMHGERECGPGQCGTPNISPSSCWKENCPWAKPHEIRIALEEFCSVKKYGKPEFWGYYADYDWVAFCHLFGTMIELPKGFPMYCRDIKQWSDELGDIRIPKPEDEIHHALVDAEWVKYAYDYLNQKAYLRKKMVNAADGSEQCDLTTAIIKPCPLT